MDALTVELRDEKRFAIFLCLVIDGYRSDWAFGAICRVPVPSLINRKIPLSFASLKRNFDLIHFFHRLAMMPAVHIMSLVKGVGGGIMTDPDIKKVQEMRKFN